MLQIAVLLPFLFAACIPFIYRRADRTHFGWLVLMLPAVLFVYFLTYIPMVADGDTYINTVEWVPSLGINFSLYIDGLSLLFVLLITGIGSLVVLYSIYYLSKKEKLSRFYVFLMMFMGAMLGVVLSDNIFVLYTFWELTSISSFLLIGFWSHRKASREGAIKSLFVTVLGGLAMLGGFILLYTVTGTASIRGMVAGADHVVNSPYYVAILVLILSGAFTKSAQFPFHIWLPDAMEAPTPVSAYLHSATMVKAGLYLVARTTLILGGTEIFFYIVSGFGLVTLCWCSYLAFRQTDLKAILAYSTVSQLGMIMAMLGYGTETAILAAVFHIFNHATFKGSLFMIAGIVDHETGTRDIRRLGGLMTLMPISATLAFFGTFSMAGVPLPIFNGFLSKEMFFDASLGVAGSAIVPVLAVLGSIFTFVYSMYLFFRTFTGEKKADLPAEKPHDPPFGMLISPIVLVALIVIIGLVPNIINGSILHPAAAAIYGHAGQEHIQFWHGLIYPPLLMSLAVVVIGTLLYITKDKWFRIYNVLPGKASVNHIYDRVMKTIYDGSSVFTKSYMTGSLGHYMSYILAFLVVTAGVSLVIGDGIRISTNNLAPISWPEVLVGVVMMIGAVATVLMNNRIAAILTLGTVGYGLSLLFVFFRAPDLALTQLVIETVTVVLFLLCFYHLPKLKKPEVSRARQTFNILISAGVGVIVTLTAISAHSTKKFETIATYFLEHSVDLGGGHNVVNVILVDMRGLDTMFEITVLGLAALSIYGMIKLRKKEERGK